jgi:hypothetical protein
MTIFLKTITYSHFVLVLKFRNMAKEDEVGEQY